MQGNAREQFERDDILRSFCESIFRNGHMKTLNVLTGKGMLNKRRVLRTLSFGKTTIFPSHRHERILDTRTKVAF